MQQNRDYQSRGVHRCGCALRLTIMPVLSPRMARQVLARAVRNDETAVVALFDVAAAHGAAALVIDTTGYDSGAAGHAAAQRDLPVAPASPA